MTGQTIEAEKEIFLEPFDDRYATDRIKYFRVDAEILYQKISEDPETLVERFGNCFTACVGGAFRSPRLARFMKEFGFNFSEIRPVGHNLTDLADDIEFGEINADGKIKPLGCNKPIDTLLINLSISDSEDLFADGLIALIPAFLKLQQKNGRLIKMDVIVVDVEVYQSRLLYNRFSKEIVETPAPGPFPNE